MTLHFAMLRNISIYCLYLHFGHSNYDLTPSHPPNQPCIQYSHFSELWAQNLGPEKAQHRPKLFFIVENDTMHTSEGRKLESNHFLKILKFSFLQRMVP